MSSSMQTTMSPDVAASPASNAACWPTLTGIAITRRHGYLVALASRTCRLPSRLASSTATTSYAHFSRSHVATTSSMVVPTMPSLW